jgi:FkbM family methyltransferase
MSIFIQIGAGAGDLDEKFPDGFTNYVKSLDKNSIEKIFLVEANPLNIKKLKECWKEYPQAIVLNIGIKPSKIKENNITFYYAEEDGPNYQVFSMIKQHVLNHLPESTIKEISVECISINDFLNNTVKMKNIELMAFDIEGIDADVILEVDWKNLNCLDFSFEKIHLHDKFEPIKKLLHENGFKEKGKGLDLRGYDVMFSRR